MSARFDFPSSDWDTLRDDVLSLESRNMEYTVKQSGTGRFLCQAPRIVRCRPVAS